MIVPMTERQARALVNCLDMVLSIQGSIKRGDPDHKPLCAVEARIRHLLLAKQKEK